MITQYDGYLAGIQASDEVRAWVSTTLAARLRRPDPPSQSAVEHVLDWLVSDAAPARLRRVSWAQAVDGAAKWTASQRRKGRDLVDGPDDLRTIHDFFDGTRIVQLLTRAAYRREGYHMAHCVGGYDPATTTVYSYRDARNIPHATFEVTRDGGQVQQVKGRGNGPIHPRYIRPILAFLQAIGQPVRPSEMCNLGYVHVPSSMRDLLARFTQADGSPIPVHVLHGEEYLRHG